jgi:hypothetical protein
MKRYLVLELELSKDIPDIADKVAGRAWMISGVEEAHIVTCETAEQLAAVIAEMVRK